MIKWTKSIEHLGNSAIIEQAKVESARMQCELTERQNEILQAILNEMKGARRDELGGGYILK